MSCKSIVSVVILLLLVATVVFIPSQIGHTTGDINMANYDPWCNNGGTIQDVTNNEPGPIPGYKTWKFIKTGTDYQWHGWESDYFGTFNGGPGECWTISGYYKTDNAAGQTQLNMGALYKPDWSAPYNTTILESRNSIIADGRWHFFYCTFMANERITNGIVADGPSWGYSNLQGELYINGLQWTKTSYVVPYKTLTNYAQYDPWWTDWRGAVGQEVTSTEPGWISGTKTWKFTKTGTDYQWHGWEQTYNGTFTANPGECWMISGYYKTNNAAGVTQLGVGAIYKPDWSSVFDTTVIDSQTNIIADGKWHYFFCTIRANESISNGIIADGPSWGYSNLQGQLYINGLQWMKIPCPLPKTPCKIEAEAYDVLSGGTIGNCSEGGSCVGWSNNSYAHYLVDVTSSGYYRMEFRVSSYFERNMEIYVDGNLAGTTLIPVTGPGWTSIYSELNLNSGIRRIQLRVNSPYGASMNWMKIQLAANSSSITDLKLTDFSNYDYDKDGTNEIERIEGFKYPSPLSLLNQNIVNNGKLVLVLVEPRILDNISGAIYSSRDLENRLVNYSNDLKNEGYTPVFLKMKVYDGNKHQDGKTLLAMRRYLNAVNQNYRIDGVVLVGSFPEAMIVRTFRHECISEDSNMTIGGTKVPKGNSYFEAGNEISSHSADIVLADIDGKWEQLYREASQPYEYIRFVPSSNPICNTTTTTSVTHDFVSAYEITNPQYADVFYLDNVSYSKSFTSANPNLSIYYSFYTFSFVLATTAKEVSQADLLHVKPVALPDINISRIDARKAACSPESVFKDLNGNPYLDSSGQPQSVLWNHSLTVFWEKDTKLERRLLVEYFDRNHRFRTSYYSSVPFQTGAVGHPFEAEWMNKYLKEAYNGLNYTAPSSNIQGPDLAQFVDWLKKPITLRGIMAHSGSQGSAFNMPGNATNIFFDSTGNQIVIKYFSPEIEMSNLQNVIGSNVKPWNWIVSANNPQLYEPSYLGNGDYKDMDHIDTALYRTIWESGILKNNVPCFYVHAGCNASTPSESELFPYNHQRYGLCQNAEGLLFFCNGLAIAARTRVHNDTLFPVGMALGEGKPFGGGLLSQYYDIANGNSDWGQVHCSNQPYYWTIFGDWTLKRRY